eukprot:CAMPEP_0194395344 /NCGR_PEP_ID=MMETSP0174-20130528/124369_1 /TAXON_ID=216777 /ORGANISM="Proboscia alata, Strain PI-D3" /LENGTH=861 /DNA_ID=CAMNT_0039191265 /DNA_START=1074 /DNA_END=3659 /DNA_ORIENTATION=-
MRMCDAAIKRDPKGTSGGIGTLGHTGQKIKKQMEETLNKTGKKQMYEMEIEDAKTRFKHLAAGNNEAAFQGQWRKTPFPERKYDLLSSNVICMGLSDVDQRCAEFELKTTLPDSFVGVPYTYDDHGESEGWMKSFGGAVETHLEKRNKTSERKKKMDNDEARAEKAAAALAADEDVAKAQVRNTMQALLISVQAKCMTDAGVLEERELVSAQWEEKQEIPLSTGLCDKMSCTTVGKLANTNTSSSNLTYDVVEHPVWGIDCYTRRNVVRCLTEEPDLPIEEFIEKWLLPAINSCPIEVAHNITCAARVLEGLPPMNKTKESPSSNVCSKTSASAHRILCKAFAEKVSRAPQWVSRAARQLRLASEALGEDAFRVHPKGHGAVVVREEGFRAHKLVTQYRGEVYPAWRWGEKMDAIEETQARLGLRPALADFYNMTLERPRNDPRGYDLLFVDASRKAGWGSSFSHSCSPSCEVRIVALDNRLSLSIATTRDIERGEELTFDYNAVTESVNEYHAAICLCGNMKCRGSFLHFATADCYQQVLERNSPISVRLASLMRSSTKKKISREDSLVLKRHGFGTAAFGAISFFSSNTRSVNGDKPSLDKNSKFQSQIDSINHVPVWLQTFVADTLRYIEYERRGLPVALLCDHFMTNTPGKAGLQKKKPGGKNKCEKAKSPAKKSSKSSEKKQSDSEDKISTKAISGSKAQSSFIFFSNNQRHVFNEQLIENGESLLKGIELTRQIQKLASIKWKTFSQEEKQSWKDASIVDWKKKGGIKLAEAEERRKRKMKVEKSAREKNDREDSKRQKLNNEVTDDIAMDESERNHREEEEKLLKETEKAKKEWEKVEGSNSLNIKKRKGYQSG